MNKQAYAVIMDARSA